MNYCCMDLLLYIDPCSKGKPLQRKELGVMAFNCSCLALDLHRVFMFYWQLHERDYIPSIWSKRVTALYGRHDGLELQLNSSQAVAYVSVSDSSFILVFFCFKASCSGPACSGSCVLFWFCAYDRCLFSADFSRALLPQISHQRPRRDPSSHPERKDVHLHICDGLPPSVELASPRNHSHKVRVIKYGLQRRVPHPTPYRVTTALTDTGRLLMR